MAEQSVGSAGTIGISDNGVNTLQFYVRCADPATYSGGYPWRIYINGGWSAWQSTNLGTIGNSNRVLWSGNVSYSQTVYFEQGNTGTMGMGNGGSVSQYVSRATVPAQVGTPTVSEEGLNTMRVSWSLPSNGGAALDQIILRRYPTAADRAADTNYSQYVLSGSTTTHKPTDLAPGEDYWWVVYAHNAVGYSTQSPFRVGYTTNVVPSKPVAPTLVGKSATQIVTNHVDPVNTGSPILERALFNVTTNETRNVAPGNQTWSGLTRASGYTFRQRVRNAAGWSEWSDDLAVNTPGTAPSAPASYVATDVASTSAVISLGTLSDNGGQIPTKVRVKISTTASDVGLAQTVVGDEWLPLPVYGLTPDTDYYVAEAAFNTVEGGGWGAYGSWVSFKTKNNVPTHPQTVTIDDIFADAATANWLAPSSLLGSVLTNYVIRVARNKQMTTGLVETTTVPGDLDKILPDLTNGTVYWVELSSMSSNGKGSAAAPVSFLTSGGASPEDTIWMNVPGVGIRHGKLWMNIPGVGVREIKPWAHVPGVGIREGV